MRKSFIRLGMAVKNQLQKLQQGNPYWQNSCFLA